MRSACIVMTVRYSRLWLTKGYTRRLGWRKNNDFKGKKSNVSNAVGYILIFFHSDRNSSFDSIVGVAPDI